MSGLTDDQTVLDRSISLKALSVLENRAGKAALSPPNKLRII